jgi:uncharacterized membrane protein YhhN
MLASVLTLLAIVSASMHILAEYRGPRLRVYIFKPLTMVIILLIAFLGQGASPFYKYMIITGLVFSLAGDVFLMLPRDRFVAGLVAFLIAHLFYIAAFAPEINGLVWWPLVPLVIYAIVIYRILSPFLGRLQLPVLFYIVVILVMAWLAFERWSHVDQTGALMAFIGALLFVVSDTILAIDRFRGTFKSAPALKLATYFAAQWLLAGSVGASLL